MCFDANLNIYKGGLPAGKRQGKIRSVGRCDKLVVLVMLYYKSLDHIFLSSSIFTKKVSDLT